MWIEIVEAVRARSGIRGIREVSWLLDGHRLVGIIAQSGGFFVHLAVGQEGRSSNGTVLTRAGGLLIAAAQDAVSDVDLNPVLVQPAGQGASIVDAVFTLQGH